MMVQMSKRIAIRDMSCAAIDVKPIDFDWNGETYGERWDFVAADTCETCGAIVVGEGEDVQHCDVDEESTCTGHVSLSPPMMSYYYPVEIDDRRDAARKLAHLPLCVVEVDGKTGLALTGGGMDLSWEICEAFMTLGILPPAHFADLPGMAGRGTSERDRWIAAGCIKSCVVAAGWAKARAKRVRATLASAVERESKKAKRAS